MSVDEIVEFSAEPLDSIYLSDLLDSINAAQDHLSGGDGTPLSPSFFSPTTVWTAQEKTAFFHALSVHSRFRPDLISNEIKTKSVQDVCNYLSVLQHATSQQETHVPYFQWRQNLPIAMEVSPEWIAMEEEKADGVTGKEQDWQREFVVEQRHAEIKLLRKVSRAESHNLASGQHKAALKKKIADADLRAQQEDFCGSLGPPELTAIGTILRGVTDSPGSNQIKPAALHTPKLQHSAGHVASLETVGTLPFPTTNGADGISYDNRAQRGSGEDEEPSSLGVMTPPNPPQNQDSAELLAGLSQASRRRHQKRLYMRRRRASISGVTKIDDTLECLKPGRKRVKRSPSPEGEAQWDPERLEVEGSIKRYPRMMQVAINELGDLCLAAEDLRELGVGVLNPDGVAKMLNLWDELSGDTSGHGSRVSMGTIRLLNAHVVWFVKNLVYRAITLREQERASKSETKVWKISEKAVIAREHVERAVSMANHREPNKARFFENIIAEMNHDVESEGMGRECPEHGPGVPSPPLHQDIYAPLVWIRKSEDDSEMADHTDDEDLANELLEEEELDGVDMDVEMSHESGLWDKVQMFRTAGQDAEASVKKTGRKTGYKSVEVIENSD